MYDKLQMAHLHYRRGRVLEQSGRIPEAVEAYRQALKDDPQLRAAHIALAAYYTRNGLLAKATNAWQAALDIEVEPHALGQLAAVFIEMQRLEEAQEILEECVRWWPDDSFCQFQKAALDYQQGMYEAAHERLIDLRAWQQASWQVHHLLGCCQMQLGDLDGAMTSFHRGMLLAQTAQQTATIKHSMDMVERLREFPFTISCKEELYTDHGMLCLGTANDDGINIDEYPPLLWNQQQLGRTLKRLAILLDSLNYKCTAILALNRVAQPLALALAQHQHLPLLKLDQLVTDQIVLVVCAQLHQASEIQAIRERIPQAVIFALSLEWQPQPGDDVPDIIGIATDRSQLPWEQPLQALRKQSAPNTDIEYMLEQAAQDILHTWYSLVPDDMLEQQLRWYTVAHRRHRLNRSL